MVVVKAVILTILISGLVSLHGTGFSPCLGPGSAAALCDGGGVGGQVRPNQGSNRAAQDHGFNAKISFEKYAMSPKIFTKMCQNSGRQTKPAYFQTFQPISPDHLHIIQNRFLR